jgi:tRNA dimethylallyltransferase
MKKIPKVIAVIGPTASGKSDFAVELALQNNGEIISADSRQIYTGLDIGTGKITKDEMRGIPHYMLDICPLGQDFSVAEYKRLALPILEDILSRGKTPIICGGTGQYIDTLIFDQEIPKVEPNKELRAILEERNVDDLYAELLTRDERRAKMIDKHNKVRIVRALEIIETLGEVPVQSNQTYRYETKLYLMDISRDLLRERITKRAHTRLAHGMIDEATSVIEKIQSTHRKEISEPIIKPDTSLHLRKYGLEYVAIAKHLEGTLSKEEMVTEIINTSMQYAKRQQTWNKKYSKDAIHIVVQK